MTTEPDVGWARRWKGWTIVMWMSLTMKGVAVSAVDCYSCSYTLTGSAKDFECVTDPAIVQQGQPVISCALKYCNTIRQMYVGTSQVKSFLRICEDEFRGNKCVNDPFYSTCYTSCTKDTCNGGTGIPSSAPSIKDCRTWHCGIHGDAFKNEEPTTSQAPCRGRGCRRRNRMRNRNNSARISGFKVVLMLSSLAALFFKS